MRCEGARCSTKKRELGPVVWIVDKRVPMCATCFEQWIERPGIVFDEHSIVRFDQAPDKAFEIHKGKSHPRAQHRQAIPA